MKNKDAIIIGSGQAGKPLALKLSYAGWKILLVEKSEEMLGGVCANVGCTPSKTLIASAKVMHEINTSENHGIEVSNVAINFETTQKRKDKIVSDSKKGLKERLSDAESIELIYGTASFTGDNFIKIKQNNSEQEFSADYIFINAGCRPNIPEIKGLENCKYYDSTSILELKEIPEKLIIIGGGYIGLEMGQMYSRFGSKVTIVEQSDQIMSGEDSDIANSLLEILEDEGLAFHLNSEVESVENTGEDVKVHYLKNNKKHQITGTHLLLVTGRKSNADLLNIENSNIKMDKKGFVKVNDRLETNVNGVYALGDINGGPQFTHIAYNDYVIVSENILDKENCSTKDRIVPYTMFTDPQLGRVGLSEKEAEKQGLNFQMINIPGKRITRGLESATIQGLWKAIIEKKSGKILGASIICTEGGEIASIIQMAMEGGILAKDLAKGIFSHPTYSESLNTLFSELEKI